MKKKKKNKKEKKKDKKKTEIQTFKQIQIYLKVDSLWREQLKQIRTYKKCKRTNKI